MKFDWSQIIALLLPHLPKLMEALVNAIVRWLEGAKEEQLVAVGKNLGKLYNAAKSEIV